MSKIKALPEELRDRLEVLGTSQDPEYLAWRDQKVREALELSKSHPEKMKSEKEIWELFGLEY